MSSYKSSKMSNVLLSLVLILVVTLVVGAVVGAVKGKDASPDTPVNSTQQTTTNPLDDIKPVDKLTSENWVSAWVIDPSKKVDTKKFNELRGNRDTFNIIEPVDFNTLNFSRELCGNSSNPAFGTLVATDGAFYLQSNMGEGFMGNMYAYVERGSEASIQLCGAVGWGKMSYLGFEPLTEKTLFQLPVEMRYDVANYNLVKDFLTPVLVENLERVEPAPLEANRPVKGFKVKDCYINVEDSNIHVGDVLLEGTVISNPMGLETSKVQVQFSIDSYNLVLNLNAGACSDESIFGSKGELVDGSLISDFPSSISDEVLFKNGAVCVFSDTSAYMEQKLWRFLEPIYAEKVADPAEAKIVGYSIDMDKIDYVAMESDYNQNSFEVYNHTLSIGELSVNSIYIYCSKSAIGQDSSLRYYYISDEDLAAIQAQMTAESYTGTLNEYISENDYVDPCAPIGEPYGISKYALDSSYNDSSVIAFVDWLNANGFKDAVTPIYSQYK